MRKVTVLKSFTGDNIKGSKGQTIDLADDLAVSLEGSGIVTIIEDEPKAPAAKAVAKPAAPAKGKKK